MSSELLLLAVRYVSNELTEREVSSFEERLAVDQSAREAVAEAVELAFVIARLGPNEAPGGSLRSRRRSLSRLAPLALAASVLFALGLVFFSYHGTRRHGNQTDPVPTYSLAKQTAQPSAEVALAWSHLSHDTEIDLPPHQEPDSVTWLDEPNGSIPVEQVASNLLDLNLEGQEESLPAWLLEAASLGNGATNGTLEN